MNEPDECIAYAEHMHHEHRRLNRLLLEIGRDFGRLDSPLRPPELLTHLSERIADLRQQLQAHYAEEEAGGCLEEAVTRCPSLACDCQAIVAEHPLLDRMLGDLLAKTRDATARPAEQQQAWRDFYTKIQLHDAAETRLLQTAFGAEAADHDVEEAE